MMYKFWIYGVVTVVGLSAALCPSTSQACWLTNCFSCCKPKPVATYAVAPACNVCPQQVSYVPQTSFRAVETCVPCTTCKPETICDPCTGTAQTVMRPVTTMVRRQVMVPYTTYRPVVTPVATAASPCNTGAAYNSPYYAGMATNVGAPMVSAAPSGCSNCASGSGAAMAMPGYGGTTFSAPITSQPAIGAGPTPAINGAPGSQPQQTFQNYPSQGYGGSYPSTPAPNAVPSQGDNGGQQNGAQQNGGHNHDNNGAPTGAGSSGSAYHQPIPDYNRLQNAPPYNGPAFNNNGANDPANHTTARPSYRSAIVPAIFGKPLLSSTAQTGAAQNSAFVRPASLSRTIEQPKTTVDDGWRPMGGR